MFLFSSDSAQDSVVYDPVKTTSHSKNTSDDFNFGLKSPKIKQSEIFKLSVRNIYSIEYNL